MLNGLRIVSRQEIAKNLQPEREESTEKKRHGKHKERKRKHKLRRSRYSSDEEGGDNEKKRRHKHGKQLKKKKIQHTDSSDDDGSTSSDHKQLRSSKHGKKKKKFYDSDLSFGSETESEESDCEAHGTVNKDESVAGRKAVGLEWMIKPPSPPIKKAETERPFIEEKPELNPKELNPYLKDGGSGYPSDITDQRASLKSSVVPAHVVGDGGLSWRLKALKRAKEQAEREGRKLDQVLEERWGSLGEMTASVVARRGAHANAHLHAIKDRRRNLNDARLEKNDGLDGDNAGQQAPGKKVYTENREYLQGISVRNPRMKAPKVGDSLSWKRSRSGLDHSMRPEDTDIIREATACLNKFDNDGSFLKNFNKQAADPGPQFEQNSEPTKFIDATDEEGAQRDASNVSMPTTMTNISFEGKSANQLAAKALQLRLQGKCKEADELMSQAQNLKQVEASHLEDSQGRRDTRTKKLESQNNGLSLKSIVGDYERHARNNDIDAGMADSIMRNKQYNKFISVDDEYESIQNSDDKKRRQPSKNAGEKEARQAIRVHKRIVTQEERCQFCFGNPSRPRHLITSIANSAYLMLPPWEPLVEGHCLIVPMQHEGSTRNLDDDVWEEVRNYKKCLLRMFAVQEKDAIFIETAMHLAQQRRHCLVECIPVPSQVAKQAPLYFKKAIDEAEDEWSQHNAKKLIDTSKKGLRGCIPKNFPYFHVEFGLHAGYVHVIDNERDFKTHFGRDVIIGLLKLPEEEMHRRRKQLSHEQQMKSVLAFQKMWDPVDWTKMLD